MAERIHQERKRGGETRTAEVNEETTKKIGETAMDSEKLKAELDNLLDEIDEVLETNAEDFVKGYVQKGGE